MRLSIQGLESKCKAFGFVLPTSIPCFKFLHVSSLTLFLFQVFW